MARIVGLSGTVNTSEVMVPLDKSSISAESFGPMVEWNSVFIKNTHSTLNLEVRVQPGVNGIVLTPGQSISISAGAFAIKPGAIWLVGSGSNVSYVGYAILV
jgi:hypothetical protein